MTQGAGKRLLTALAGLFVAVLIVYAFLPSPVPVDLAAVDSGLLQVTVEGEGKTRIKDIYTVSAPIAGRVTRIEIEAGETVTAGQTVVARIEPSQPEFLNVRSQAQAEARLSEAEANKSLADAGLQKALAEAAYAGSEYKRAKALPLGRSITQRALDDSERMVKTRGADVVIARAAVAVAEFQLAAARATLIAPGQGPGQDQGIGAGGCCIELLAPVSGRVLRVIDESERVVVSGQPLLEIGDPKSLEVVVDLLSADAVKVKPGASAMIEHWGGDYVLGGRVRVVEPSGFTKISALGIEEQRVNVIIDFTDPPERRLTLGDGYRIEARIVVWQDYHAFRAPVSALFRHGEAWAVYVAEDGRARLREVEIGGRNSSAAQILDGLTEGELVIPHPGDRITDGVRIVVR